MFGSMNEVRPLLDLQGDQRSLEMAVKHFLEMAEQPEIAEWYQLPKALLLFCLIPGNPESGALYVLDRTCGRWYLIDFNDTKFGGYTRDDFRKLLNECHFLELVENPSRLRVPKRVQWFVEPGKRPSLVDPLPMRIHTKSEVAATSSEAL